MHTKKLPTTLFAFLWHFVKQHWILCLAAQLFSFAWSIDHTIWPYIIGLIIDSITDINTDRSHIWSVLATPLQMGAILWIGVEVSFRLQGFFLAKVLPKVTADVRMAMFEYVQNHSYSYFSNNFAGTIANKISDMVLSVDNILRLIIQLFFPVFLALMISAVLFFRVNPYFSLILVSWLTLHLGFSLAFAGRCAHLADVHAFSRSNLAGKIVDSLTNHNNIRLFSRYNYERRYLSTYQEDEQEKHWLSLWYIEKVKVVMGIISFLGAGVAMNWYMFYSWQQGQITTGEVVFIFNTTWNITMMAWLAALELPTLYKEIGVCRQALSIIKEETEIQDDPQAVPLKVARGEITFEKVSFHYVPEYNIFQDKTIMINAGEKVGLVGFSGSGKTTFVNLILRYFDVESGHILIDGQDIAMVTQDSLRSQIALIPQDASLFHRTLMENIRYGRVNATDEEVIEAARQAHAHEFIQQLPEGYNTLVGERGIKLSGGQRQRIAITRAILKNAPILILDEATSSLDSVTERLIQDSLEKLIEGRTTIVIAHRLSTLSGMDRILVFKEGQIIEEGTHSELLDLEGHYAKMWHMQAGGFLPDDISEE
jgi:ATP-binding cassette, subfamily B, bacterial